MTVNPEWTLAEAQAEHDKACAANPARAWVDPTLPLFQWFALKAIDRCREAFQGGDKFELLHAIRECANHDLPLPDWAARAFISAYDTILNFKAKSWDDVLGAPIPKGAHLNVLRERRELKFGVLNRVHEILARAPETPIDQYLFETVGKEFGIGKTLAAEYYYAAKRQMGQPNDCDVLLDSWRVPDWDTK